MTDAAILRKTMTIGEGGTALAFATLALLSIYIAANAYTPEYAFHAYLFAAASTAAVFAIVSRYYDRPTQLPPLMIAGKPNYNMGPVKFATVAAVFWGIAGFTRRPLGGARARLPDPQFRSAMALVRPHPAAAHVGGDLRIRRQRSDRHLVLRGAADLPRPSRRRHCALVRGARLQPLHRHRRHRVSARHHPIQGICRAGVVRRPVAHGGVGRLLPGFSRHDHAAQRAAHLRRQLVLSRLHSHHRGAASRQQCRDPGLAVLTEILHRLGRRAGCHGAVVVRPQRGRLLPHRRLPRDHVLLHPEAGRAADLQLPAFDHPLLVVDLPLYLGRAAPSSLHRTARLDADARHDVLDHAVDAVLGRHDQRPDDALGRVGQAAHRSRAAHAGGVGRLLRHGHVRGAVDVDEGGQLAFALHRLDHRPRAFRRARLGRLRLVRCHLLPGAVAVEPQGALFAAAGQLALLDLVDRHRALHLARCGCPASCRA